MGIGEVKRPAVFLDRDGVINAAIVRDLKAYSPRSREEFSIVAEAPAAIRKLKEAGFYVMVVTNQPDVARKKLKEEDLDWMHDRIRNETAVDQIIVCPHDDRDGCTCRKPKPGMLTHCAEKWEIDLNRSFMIGDGWKDMEAGRKAGCACILVEAGYNRDVSCDFRVGGLLEAVEIIINVGREKLKILI